MIEYEISDSERIFLKSQNISVYELFNAKGRPIPQCKARNGKIMVNYLLIIQLLVENMDIH